MVFSGERGAGCGWHRSFATVFSGDHGAVCDGFLGRSCLGNVDDDGDDNNDDIRSVDRAGCRPGLWPAPEATAEIQTPSWR